MSNTGMSSAQLALASRNIAKGRVETKDSVEVRTIEPFNFFSLLTFTRQPVPRAIIVLIFFESISCFFQIFIPVYASAQMWSYSMAVGITTAAPSLTESNPPPENPLNALIVALLSSVTLFGIYMAIPGATGQWWFVVEQWCCEWYNVVIYPDQPDRDIVVGFGLYVLCILKLFVGIASTAIAAFAAIHTVDALGEPNGVRLAFDALTRRPGDTLIAIVLEAMLFIPFVVMFNLFYRTGPYGQRSKLANSNPAFNALLLAGSNFVGVFVLFSYSGSLMNFMGALAVSFDRRSYGDGLTSQFIGHLVGGMIGWGFSAFFHHSIAWSSEHPYTVLKERNLARWKQCIRHACCRTSSELMADYNKGYDDDSKTPLMTGNGANTVSVFVQSGKLNDGALKMKQHQPPSYKQNNDN